MQPDIIRGEDTLLLIVICHIAYLGKDDNEQLTYCYKTSLTALLSLEIVNYKFNKGYGNHIDE